MTAYLPPRPLLPIYLGLQTRLADWSRGGLLVAYEPTAPLCLLLGTIMQRHP